MFQQTPHQNTKKDTASIQGHGYIQCVYIYMHADQVLSLVGGVPNAQMKIVVCKQPYERQTVHYVWVDEMSCRLFLENDI